MGMFCHQRILFVNSNHPFFSASDGNATQTRRDFSELLARFNEKQERRKAFELFARDVVVDGLLGRRALIEREGLE